MLKLEENKPRKRLRIAMCVFYLMQIFFCSLPFYHFIDSNGNLDSYSVISMLSFIGGEIPNTSAGAMFQQTLFYFMLPIIIPALGFFFCLFDRKRNLKNIVSIFCSLGGVISIIILQDGNYISLGAVLSLLVYILICFLTTMAMFARIVKEPDKETEKK